MCNLWEKAFLTLLWGKVDKHFKDRLSDLSGDFMTHYIYLPVSIERHLYSGRESLKHGKLWKHMQIEKTGAN